MDLIPSLNWRCATKVFDTKTIPEKDFDILLESLRLSPSSFGIQPWRFLIIKDKKIREKLLPLSWGQPQVKDASHLILLCARTDVDEDLIRTYITQIAKARKVEPSSLKDYQDMMINFIKSLPQAQREIWAANQVYIALGFLLSAAAQLGIDACPMEGFDRDKANDLLGLKKDHLTAVVMCPVGYRSKDDSYSKLAKVRCSKEEIFQTI